MIENSRPDGSYLLHVDGLRIPFRIEHRRRKKLAISVYPELRLEVVAPEGSAREQVLPKVAKRAGWILRQWRYFERFLPRPPSPRYVSGETHVYLGRQYRLKVQQGESEGVKLLGRFLHVRVGDRNDAGRVRTLLERWYRKHAERIFRHRLECCLESSSSLKPIDSSRLTIRKMTHRWGSCTKAGDIVLNLELVKAPVQCIDYVLVHELCHRQVHNHSPAFYRLLSRCLPDWERRKRRLEEFSV